MRERRGTVLILGGSSMIARAIAAKFAAAGYDLTLAGRNREELKRTASDLGIRHGCLAGALPFDALKTEDHAGLVARVAESSPGRLAGAVVAFGLLGDAERAERDYGHAEEIIRVNYLGAVSVLTHLAIHLERQRSGFLIVISSVAGERGRPSNYVYGSAKGALSIFLEGLRARLHKAGVTVTTVKPGFIDTRMTYGEVPERMAAPPEAVARAVVRAARRGPATVYVPRIWRLIMLVIRLIPDVVFKRLKL